MVRRGIKKVRREEIEKRKKKTQTKTGSTNEIELANEKDAYSHLLHREIYRAGRNEYHFESYNRTILIMIIISES